MSKFNHFLGIDVSKEYFDAVVILNGDKNSTVHNQFTNNAKGLKELIHWLKTNKSNAENTLTAVFLRDIMSRRATGMHFFLCV